jgi:preprotein translocase subunit YajC
MDPNMILFTVILLGWYFIYLQPMLRDQREQEALLEGLSKDDRVVTASGMHGRINKVDDELVVIEVSKNTLITVDKSSIARSLDDATAKK